MITDYFSLAYKNLKKRKLRSWLTILGIIISVATIFMLVSISLGLQSAVEEQFAQLGKDKFFIQPKGQIAGPGTDSAAILTQQDMEIIKKVPGVKSTSYFLIGSGKIEFNRETRFYNLVGIPEDAANIMLETGIYKIDSGRFVQQGDIEDIVIGNNYHYKSVFSRPVNIGDKVTINGQQFKVRGIIQPVGNPQDDKSIIMPAQQFRVLLNIPERIDQIMVKVDSDSDVREVAKRVEKKLRSSRQVTEDTQDFTILTPEEVLDSFKSILNIITAFLAGVAAISLLVGGIGIANTMFTSVLERTREIGTMKAVGAKNKDILLIFLIESGLIGLTGGIIGTLLGFSVSKTIEYIAMHQLGTKLLQAAAPAYLITGCLLFAFVIGAISGIVPAYRASKPKTVDALRYE